MAPNLRLNAVAFISPQNHPILIRTFMKQDETAIKYHYIAHTSLDVIEERGLASSKSSECYLGLLYSMEDVAVYGYITPLKVKIVLATALTDAVARDVDINMASRKTLHMAYYSAISNPFLVLQDSSGTIHDTFRPLLAGSPKWKHLRRRVDEIARIVGNPSDNSTAGG
ncbi:Sedlin, N-terminal conserved region-domain-containing protein [Lentinula boryana]|uniref:Trafficking protein particle complex subunit 2-like protein n=1 Tax=Lentinula boryana TaxID=40481 RepID=A0ABQ8QKV5_9AGAR|nr:Sedlin, N-terminal conserved region-domain-containing protein [Lentinula boryana]